jgi:hypothetical protein
VKILKFERFLESQKEFIPGGLSQGMTLEDLARHHDARGNSDLRDLVDSLKQELAMGISVEMEHTDSREMAREIAMDHLYEDPNYYTKLKKYIEN